MAFFHSVGVKAGAVVPTVSWYYKGALQTAATTTTASATLSNGTALTLSCVAKGVNTVPASINPGGTAMPARTVRFHLNPAFAISKGTTAPTLSVTLPLSAVTVTGTNGVDSTIAETGTSMNVGVTGGTRVWDSINGNAANYDYFIIHQAMTQAILGAPNAGTLQMFIPTLTTSDAGTYYCAYYDGSATINAAGVAANLGGPGGYLRAAADSPLLDITLRNANSNPFTLAVTTPATATSTSSRNSPTTKSIQYSLALLGASAMLF